MKYAKEKLAGVLLIAAVITNPLVNVYVESGLEWGFNQMRENSGFVALLFNVYIAGLMVFYYQKAYRTKIPKKTAQKAPKKARWQKYIEV